MDCEQALLLISAALDGELTAGDEALLCEHLAQCPDCQELADDLGVLSAALSELEVSVPEGLVSGVAEAIVRSRKKSKLPWSAWGALAAALAVVVCLQTGRFFAPRANDSGLMSEESTYAEVGAASGAAAEGGSADPSEAAGGSGGGSLRSAPYSKDEKFSSQDTDQSGITEFALPGDSAPDDSSEDTAADATEPGFADSPEEPEPAADVPAGSLTESALSDSSQLLSALNKTFDLLGGLASFPDAALEVENLRYLLERGQVGVYSWDKYLEYEGMSPNDAYYIFRIVAYQTQEENGSLVYQTTSMGCYALSLDASSLLSETENMSAYYQAISQ